MSWGANLLSSICFLFFWDALATSENDDSFVEVADWALLVFKEDVEDADGGTCADDVDDVSPFPSWLFIVNAKIVEDEQPEKILRTAGNKFYTEVKEANQEGKLSKEDCTVRSVELISQGQGYRADDVANKLYQLILKKH